MCRLLVYKGSVPVTLADLLTRPSHSIIRQSYGCRERFGDGLSGLPPALNADGFGVAWYASPAPHACVCTGSHAHTHASGATAAADSQAPADMPAPATPGVKRSREEALAPAPAASWDVPGVYTSVAPAWSDVNLSRLSEKIASNTVFAHIRAASIGSAVHEYNCHPFQVSRYLWMHNGHIGGFSRLRRRMIFHMSETAMGSIRGTTDSEHLFGVFLTEVERVATGGKAAPVNSGFRAWRKLSPAELQECMLRTLALIDAWRAEAGIDDVSLLNVCLTDGETVIASRIVLPLNSDQRAASLYFTSGSRWAPRTDGAAAEPAPLGVEYTMMQADRREHAVVVASERLTSCAADWLPVPKNSLLVVHPSMAILRVPVLQLPCVDSTMVLLPAGLSLGSAFQASTASARPGGCSSELQRKRALACASARDGCAMGSDEVQSIDSCATKESTAAACGTASNDEREDVTQASSSMSLASPTSATIEPVWMQPWRLAGSSGRADTNAAKDVSPPSVYVLDAATRACASIAASAADILKSSSSVTNSPRPQMFCAGRPILTNEFRETSTCSMQTVPAAGPVEHVCTFDGASVFQDTGAACQPPPLALS